MAEEVLFSSFEERAFFVGGGEGDATVDHSVAYLDNLAVKYPFGVIPAGGKWAGVGEAGPHLGCSIPERFELGGKGRGTAASGLVLS